MSRNIFKETIRIIQLVFEAAWPAFRCVVSGTVIIALQDCNFYKRKLFEFHLSLHHNLVLK